MKSLLLSRNAIPSDALATLARTLSSRRSLQFLDLSSTGAGDAGAHALLPLLQSAGCPIELNLKDNAIGTAGAVRLLGAAAISHSLQVLDLSNNVIDDSVRYMHCSIFLRFSPSAEGCSCNTGSLFGKQRLEAHSGRKLLGQQR